MASYIFCPNKSNVGYIHKFPQTLILVVNNTIKHQINKNQQDYIVVDNVQKLQLIDYESQAKQQTYNIDLQVEYNNIVVKESLFYYQLITVNQKNNQHQQQSHLKKFKPGLILGHRGCGADIYCDYAHHIQENTIQSFTKALQRQDGIEIDIQITKDGELVIHHNYEFQVNGQIQYIFSAESKNLPKYIPTFMQTMEVFMENNHNNSKLLDIEVKYPQKLINEFKDFPSRRLIVDNLKNQITQMEQKYNKLNIFFSTFDPVICLLLKHELKYPVYFLNAGIIVNKYSNSQSIDFTSKLSQNIYNGTRFALQHKLDGIVTNKSLIRIFFLYLRQMRKQHFNVLVWGYSLQNEKHRIKYQSLIKKKLIQGVIVDGVDFE